MHTLIEGREASRPHVMVRSSGLPGRRIAAKTETIKPVCSSFDPPAVRRLLRLASRSPREEGAGQSLAIAPDRVPGEQELDSGWGVHADGMVVLCRGTVWRVNHPTALDPHERGGVRRCRHPGSINGEVYQTGVDIALMTSKPAFPLSHRYKCP